MHSMQSKTVMQKTYVILKRVQRDNTQKYMIIIHNVGLFFISHKYLFYTS